MSGVNKLFDIPELKEEVAKYLTRADLARVTIASKTWSNWFSPPLWRVINFKNGISSKAPFRSALQKYKYHVHKMILHKINVPCGYGELWTFPLLYSLEYTIPWKKPDLREFKRLTRLIDTSSLLQKLVLDIGDFTKPKHQKLLCDSLEAHDQLQMLDLHWGCEVSTHIQQLIFACRKIKVLHLQVERPWNSWSVPYNYLDGWIAESNMENMPNTEIQELQVRLPLKQHESKIVLPLLGKCPLLKRLDLGSGWDEKALHKIALRLKNKACPLLNHLRLWGDVISEREISAIIQCVGSANDDGSDQVGAACKRGLKTLCVDDEFRFGRLATQAVISHHAETLTTLDLDRNQLPFDLFIGLMSSLPGLASATLGVLIGGAKNLEPQHQNTLLHTSWACQALTTLKMRIRCNRMDDIKGQNQAGSFKDQCFEYMFSEIGKLHYLKHMSLCLLPGSLSLDHDYLNLISDLDRLKRVELCGCGTLDGQKAQWMLDHWSQLARVDLEQNMDEEGVVELLKDQRPWLQVGLSAF